MVCDIDLRLMTSNITNIKVISHPLIASTQRLRQVLLKPHTSNLKPHTSIIPPHNLIIHDHFFHGIGVDGALAGINNFSARFYKNGVG